MFYCHIQPAILLTQIFNLTVFYYIMKYLLFRRSKIPELTELQIFQLVISAFLTGAAVYGVGSLFFVVEAQL